MPGTLDFPQFLKQVSQSHTLRRETAPEAVYALFDTFDWRLYGKRQILVREGDRIALADLELTRLSGQEVWTGQNPPRFWWDLPEGELRDRLRTRLDVRALLPLLSVTRKGRRLRVLNQDRKTVLMLDVCHYVVEALSGVPRKTSRLELQPVLGYGRELRAFKAYLRNMGVTRDVESVYVAMMRLAGLSPGGYSSKFRPALDPELPAGDAVRRILRHLVEVMITNEQGIKADTDTEFLHDFRVAIRRTRSALGQLKGIFPPDDTARFREEFTRLGRATNALRDLDVYLLKKERYRAMLPDHLAPGLEALFQDLAASRKIERRAVTRILDSAPYRTAMTQWQEFLDSPADHTNERAPNAQRPVFPLACRCIFKRYLRIIRAGRRIGDDSPDEELHRLRISCKKLRYLLEFFASLFPDKDMTHLIGQLKKLQDNLGDFNDLFVQQQYLQDHLDRMDESVGRLRLPAAAVGGLITSLNQKQKRVRLDFAKRFRAFSSAGNRALFARLFKDPTARREEG